MSFIKQKEFQDLKNLVKSLEEKLWQTQKQLIESDLKQSYNVATQPTTYNGVHLAWCVDTVDPLKQNRVRFYSPLFHDPKKTANDQLPWAYPISPFGGFDDSGANWVPPAGSLLAIVFEAGNRDRPYYIGTVWHRDRGESPYVWQYGIEEFNELWAGKRDGYTSAGNNNKEVFAPHNTENYNGIDVDSEVTFEKDDQAKKKITSPHIYSIKTPGKHCIKLDDGDRKCNNRWGRLEIFSSRGNYMIFKDDPLHPTGQWAHPDGGCGGGDVSDCPDKDDTSCVTPEDRPKCANPYYKRLEECRPYHGPGTPQNNQVSLDQTGISFLSYGGHLFGMDDSVEQPTGKPDWHDALSPFGFGCTNKCRGKTYWVSMTGHRIEMNDHEEQEEIRSDQNYIKLLTACGNRIELNDHTVDGCIAGEKRGIEIETTSGHLFRMNDEENQQCQPRKEGGEPTSQAKKGYILLRSGYGLEFLMKDESSQQNTDAQYIQIKAPQKDNTARGPHWLRMQEKPDGAGLIFLRAGGVYLRTSYDDAVELVGRKDENPANKLVYVTKNYMTKVDEVYFRHADINYVRASRFGFFVAGKDCPNEDGEECCPCIYPVLCAREPWCCPIFNTVHFTSKAVSDRIFVSHSGEGGSHYCPPPSSE